MVWALRPIWKPVMYKNTVARPKTRKRYWLMIIFKHLLEVDLQSKDHKLVNKLDISSDI